MVDFTKPVYVDVNGNLTNIDPHAAYDSTGAATQSAQSILTNGAIIDPNAPLLGYGKPVNTTPADAAINTDSATASGPSPESQIHKWIGYDLIDVGVGVFAVALILLVLFRSAGSVEVAKTVAV